MHPQLIQKIYCSICHWCPNIFDLWDNPSHRPSAQQIHISSENNCLIFSGPILFSVFFIVWPVSIPPIISTYFWENYLHLFKLKLINGCNCNPLFWTAKLLLLFCDTAYFCVDPFLRILGKFVPKHSGKKPKQVQSTLGIVFELNLDSGFICRKSRSAIWSKLDTLIVFASSSSRLDKTDHVSTGKSHHEQF